MNEWAIMETIEVGTSGIAASRMGLDTEAGLEWRDGKVRRNSAPAHVRKEVDESLRRLRTDRIDLYVVQWPDPLTPIAETAKTLARLGLQSTIALD